MKFVIWFALLAFLPASYAATFSYSGSINTLSSITTRDGSDYMLLEGFSQAGSCPVSQGLVVARFPVSVGGSRAFAIALTAMMANKSVVLAVDDTVKHPEDGGCFVKSLRLTN